MDPTVSLEMPQVTYPRLFVAFCFDTVVSSASNRLPGSHEDIRLFRRGEEQLANLEMFIICFSGILLTTVRSSH